MAAIRAYKPDSRVTLTSHVMGRRQQFPTTPGAET